MLDANAGVADLLGSADEKGDFAPLEPSAEGEAAAAKLAGFALKPAKPDPALAETGAGVAAGVPKPEKPVFPAAPKVALWPKAGAAEAGLAEAPNEA